ncbi:MAG TPA: MFS transporter [Kofleriaceae bacterium]
MESVPPRKAFSALGLPGYRIYLVTFALTMMADNVEHVISYWVVFRKFHSAALGGFAVVAHWVPYLGLAVTVGALNDRFDSRRLIQAGGLLFMFVSACWGYFFATDSIEMWHAMVLLALHGCASLLWVTSSQVLLYYVVGPKALPSAVRLAATARYLGLLVGPGVGSVILVTLGPKVGIFVNVAFYVPLVVWLIRAPYGRQFGSAQTTTPRRAVRGLADVLQTVREVRAIPLVAMMIALAGSASFFLASGYHSQMPGFAQDLGHGDPGTAYTMLLAADATGALIAGIALESSGALEPRARSAMVLAVAWALALAGFATTRSYPLALVLLLLAGFFELSFSSMAQTLVQTNAPEASRGRVLGLYNMASMGLRAFSGVTVGLAGSVISIHRSLPLAAAFLLATICMLLFWLRRVGRSVIV